MKFFLLKVIFLLGYVAVSAQDSAAVAAFDLSGGYQATDLRWSIAGKTNEEAINILSEVKWRTLSGPLLNGRLKLNVNRRLFVGGEVSKCFIKTGSATDTDYGDNDRRLPTYHAQLDSDEGSLLAFRLFGGYNFLQRTRVQIALLGGYTENKAFLLLLNRAENVAGQKNLRCTYNTSWKGISGGVYGLFRVASWLDVTSELQYSQMNYLAVADWNLIDAFQHPVSFKQRARGFDLRMSLSSVFKLNSYFALFMSGEYNHAETGTGTDELFLDSGAVQTTQFNGVFTQAKKILIGTRIQF